MLIVTSDPLFLNGCAAKSLNTIGSMYKEALLYFLDFGSILH